MNVRQFEEGVIREDFLVRCAGGKQLQQVDNTESHPANARAATALVCIDCNALK